MNLLKARDTLTFQAMRVYCTHKSMITILLECKAIKTGSKRHIVVNAKKGKSFRVCGEKQILKIICRFKNRQILQNTRSKQLKIVRF